MVLENQAQQIAQELNEERRLLVIRPDWSRIVQEVIAVDLDIKWWHGETRLRQEDLGFEEVEPEYRDFLSKNIILGRKRLMPDRIDEAAVRRVRRELLRPERAEVLALPL